jgi:predicted negative regulator of RcsB-dependent stress response
LLIAVAYFGWRYYQNECIDKKSNEKISQKVAEEMAKKIKEDAEMHRKGRKEGEE